jgi:hypothetical protein
MHLNLIFLNNYIVQDYSFHNNSVRPVIYEIIIQWSLYKPNLIGVSFCVGNIKSVLFIQVELDNKDFLHLDFT